MDLFRIYADFLSNIFIFFTLDLFLNQYTKCINKEKQRPIKMCFFFLWIILSIIPAYPFYIGYLIEFLYICLITQNKFSRRILLLCCFRLYYITFTIIFTLLHTVFTLDLTIFANNDIYADYINILDCFLLYITLSMYIILKKLSEFPTGKIYKRYFLGITCIIVVLLIVCSMFLGSTILPAENIVPLFFTLLLVITLLCISIYRRVVSVLEESMRAKIEVEKNAMQQEYAANVEENLKKLSLLRHDFKNHLIIIQGYAKDNRKEELLEYINSITQKLATTTLINTPSTTLSTIINAKKSDCERTNVKFEFQWAFEKLVLTDFDMVTIISNLLDNALLASRKCEGGFIKLSVIQKGSLLEIDCLNNHQEKINEKQGIFITTKTERPEIHGMGLISIRKTIERLGGEMDIDYTDNRFHVNILVPNYS